MNDLKRITRRRQARAVRTKVRVVSDVKRPRLVVHRSNQQIHAQIIDQQGQILASAGSIKLKAKDKTDAATQIGELIAKAAIAKKIVEVSFDRKHYKYHGRVKILAESARQHGLKF